MIDMRIKDMFFDRKRVVRSVDAARRRVLSKAGAFIRTRARTSIRKRKGPSKPGSPPHSHEGSLRRHIFFGYDATTKSVVVGPVGFRRSRVPRVLEEGGDSIRYRFDRDSRRVKKKPVRIRARPYMAPALEAEQDNFAQLWKGSIKAR